VSTQRPPRGALFQAALGLLAGEADPLARLCLLRDAFPAASITEIERTLRETAVTFHSHGIVPVPRDV
jgi:hypothetical protein